MTRFTSFVDSFWESDFTGTRGLDVLCHRMKDGRKVCVAIEQFLKERAKIEAEYAKSLLTLSRKLDNKEEIGELATALKELKAQTETIAHAHEQAQTRFLQLDEDIGKFSEDQKKQKTQVEDNVRKYHHHKNNTYKKTMELQKQYGQKCRDNDQANTQYQQALQLSTITPKEKDKAQHKTEKSKEQMEHADLAYKSSVTSLEAARSEWEKEMVKTCEKFQALEEDRIEFLRNTIWKCANVDSQTCVEHDDCCETVRKALELCDVQKDIQFFIDLNKTGNERPSPIVYVNYYDRRNSENSSSGQDSQGTLKRRPPHPLPSRPSAGVYPTKPLLPATLSKRHGSLTSTSSTGSLTRSSEQNYVEVDPTYASVDSVPTPPPDTKQIAEVIADHRPQ